MCVCVCEREGERAIKRDHVCCHLWRPPAKLLDTITICVTRCVQVLLPVAIGLAAVFPGRSLSGAAGAVLGDWLLQSYALLDQAVAHPSCAPEGPTSRRQVLSRWQDVLSDTADLAHDLWKYLASSVSVAPVVESLLSELQTVLARGMCWDGEGKTLALRCSMCESALRVVNTFCVLIILTRHN
jgi:hypothetical protein